LESAANIASPDFKTVVDSAFETLLTITTILSGIYVAVSFDWFSSALAEPHTGPLSPELITQAMTGVFLGLIFILPLSIVVVAWALFKFWGSSTWRTIAWSSLLYCLSQDFVGVLALLAFPLIAENIFVGPLLVASVVFVIIVPTTLGITLGYRVTVRYDRDLLRLGVRKRSYALTAITSVIAILAIQAILGLFILSL
jgi:hypothetical protein